MNNIYSKIFTLAVEKTGTKAVTMRGKIEALKKYPGIFGMVGRDLEASKKPYSKIDFDKLPNGSNLQIDTKTQPWNGMKFVPLNDYKIQDRAALSIGNCGQRSNCSHGLPRVSGAPHQARWATIEYKGKFKGYRGKHLYWDYQSCLGVSRSGGSVIVVQECFVVTRVVAPKGTKFEIDSLGVKVTRLSDEMDYHPMAFEWKDRKFKSIVRGRLAQNARARKAFKRQEREEARNKKEQLRIAKIVGREIGSTRVTLRDSRQAGNCVEGTLSYIERKLGVDRKTVLEGDYLFHVPVRRLDLGDERVRRAAMVAWNRETTVSI